MKKMIALLLAFLLLLSGCGKAEPETQQMEPAYDLPDITSEEEPEPEPEPEPEAEPEVEAETEAEEETVTTPAVVDLGPIPADFAVTAPRSRICAGAYVSAALKADGTVASNWDTISEDVGAANEDWKSWEHIVDLSLYSEAMIGLKDDGTVVWCGGREDEAWWSDSAMDAVAGWKNVAQVSAGIFDLAALQNDGTILLAGSLTSGALTERTGFLEISMGDCLLGLRRNGTVYCYFPYENNPYDVSGWENITHISAGWDHAVGLRADGTVVATGKNDCGQCDVSGWTDIVQVCAGRQHTIGLKADGTVLTTGKDYCGELKVDDWTDIVEINGRYSHTIGLKSDGTLVFAGDEAAFLNEPSIN